MTPLSSQNNKMISMKTAGMTFVFLLLLLPVYQTGHTQIGSPPTLREIAGAIDSLKGKQITLILKLKYIDTVFEKLTFYDRENIDISFDLSDYQLKKRVAPAVKNLKEGMTYRVTFTVKDKNYHGGIEGDIVDFQPVVLEFIPVTPENKKAE